jgi:O-acetyl-ADP-ribose deacetylase (regulator of RNase III)
MTVEYRTGDLFAQGLRALAHGVNCRGGMGAGVAVEFRRRWPAMYDDYHEACRAKTLEPGGLHSWTERATGTVIFNLATQNWPGRNARLEWVRSSIEAMLVIAEQRGIAAVGMPRIGAGIGGLAWAHVVAVLEDLAGGSAVNLVLVTLPGAAERRPFR